MTTLPTTAAAQSLDNRIASTSGTVAFTYETRPNVCGDGESISVSDDASAGWTVRYRRSGVSVGRRRGGDYERCDTGPAQVMLRRDGNRIVELNVTVGGRAARADTDLGDVPPDQATRYLLDIAPRLTGRAADYAVMGAYIANGPSPWQRMLRIARDDGATDYARKASIFWVSHEATAAATAGIDSIAADDDEATAVRKDALFYIAQRANAGGIPVLIRVVETSKSLALKKDAIFYLAQSRDERALALFERLLAGR